jgi:glucose/arabinose dehydrogenase
VSLLTFHDNSNKECNYKSNSNNNKTNKGRRISSAINLSLLLVLSIFLSAIVSSSTINNTASAQSVMSHPPPLVTGAVNSGKPPSNNILKIAPGYKIEPILWNLTIPSTITFDDNGSMYVAESGYSYGEFKPIPRILKLDDKGHLSVLVDRGLNGAITDLEFNKHNGLLYASHRGVISAIDGGGHIKDLIVGLPSMGDHQNNQIAFGPDGRLYFGQGTVTNTGVAGEDSYAYGWLKTSPELHDIPGKDIRLSGQNFESANPLTPQNFSDYATTGAFVPFGTSTHKGEVIKGQTKCSGCIISSKLDGTDLKVVAWGLRNPYGMAFGNDGKTLLFDNNGADERGSRRVGNDSDKVYTIDISKPNDIANWYGWPDYFGNGQPVTDPRFRSESQPSNVPLQFLMQDHPPVQKPLSLLGEGVAVTQAEFSNSSIFGFKGMAFIGEFGTAGPLIHTFAQITTPMPGFTPTIRGQKVVMLDPKTGNYTDFVSLNRIDSRFHPTGVKFDLKGDAMYIADFGKVEVRTDAIGSASGTDRLAFGTGLYPFATIHAMLWPYANTGVIWKVTKISGGENVAASTTLPSSSSTSTEINNTMSPSSTSLTSHTPGIKGNETKAIPPSTPSAKMAQAAPSPTGIPGVP